MNAERVARVAEEVFARRASQVTVRASEDDTHEVLLEMASLAFQAALAFDLVASVWLDEEE